MTNSIIENYYKFVDGSDIVECIITHYLFLNFLAVLFIVVLYDIDRADNRTIYRNDKIDEKIKANLLEVD